MKNRIILTETIKPFYPRKSIACISFITTTALIGSMLAAGIPVSRHPLEPWQFISPTKSLTQEQFTELIKNKDFLYIASVSFLVSPTGSNQTFNVPTSWNINNNKVECIAAGGSGGAATGFCCVGAIGCGGGGGGYSAQTNIHLTPGGTATYQIGTGGGAVSSTNSGHAGGSTWFNGTTLGGSTVGAQGGGAGQGGNVNSASGGTGGASASGTGATKNSGGRGGNGTVVAFFLCGTGGGGGAGPNGNGNQGVDGSSSNGTNGGSGDAGSGGAGGSGGSGGNGTEYDGSHGCGGGGGGVFNNAGVSTGGGGGNYGGGGGGAASGGFNSCSSGAGIQGLIVLTNTPATKAVYAGVIG